MTDDLITRVRSPFALTESDAQEIADALETRGKRIDELESRLVDKEARIAELEAALKPFADYWNTSKVVQISEWKNAYLTLNPQSENEPLGPSYGHDGEEK